MSTHFYTSVDLMASVPLDPQYRHTLTFSSLALQTQYFTGKVVSSYGSFSFLSYQRYRRGTIKLQAPINIMKSVNYLRFVNANYTGEGNLHENKYIYAFVVAVDYISDNVVSIEYQVDAFQTWMFDYTLNPCYVEREHANSDNLGDNLVPENLDTGDYVNMFTEAIDYWDSSSTTQIKNNSYYIVIATQSPAGYQGTVRMSGVPTWLYAEYAESVTDLQQILEDYQTGATQSLEPIIAINMGPLWLTEDTTTHEEYMLGSYGSYIWKIFTLEHDMDIGVGPFVGHDSTTGTMKSYSAKNKKLLTYPYNFITFEAPDGSSCMLKYENFADVGNHITFEGRMSCFPYVETLMAPRYYEYQQIGTSPNIERPFGYPANLQHALCCNAYPTVGAASDAFSAWWAQNHYSMPIIESAIHAINETKQNAYERRTSGDTGSPYVSEANKQGFDVTKSMLDYYLNKSTTGIFDTAGYAAGIFRGGGIQGLSSDIAAQLAAYKGHQALPDTVATKASNTGITHASKFDCYKVHYTRIRPEFAQIIDNYFSCYGYATHIVKYPNITGRLNWNYVQTKGCTINGNVPREAEEIITNMMDRGITFWHNPNTIHDYTQDNSIVT